MGKVELKLEIDGDLVERLEIAGIDPSKAAEAGMRVAISKAESLGGWEQSARAWTDENRDAIEEFNGHVREHGLLSDQEPFKPNWLA